MSGRMRSSGRGSGSSSGGGGDPERERRVRSDGARKRGPSKWMNRGLSSPSSFRVCETEEYDRRHRRTPSSAVGSSSAAARSSHAASSFSFGASLIPVKREWSEEPEEIEVVAVKQEPEEIGSHGVVGPEDFVTDVDAVMADIAERSLREEAEHRCHHKELEDLVFQQAVAANLAAKEKDDKWQPIGEEQKEKYIDLGSSGEED